MDREIVITIDGVESNYDLSHTLDLEITIDDFQFENGIVGPAFVKVKPTNHVYSRAIENSDDKLALDSTGELLKSYEHYPNDVDKPKKDKHGNLIVSKELRVFCQTKYEQSFFLKTFVDEVQMNISNACVMPHKSDDLKAMSALFKLPEEYGDNYYIVLFKLHKMRANLIHMIIDTAFVVGPDDFRYKLFNNKNTKPFAVLMKNVFAGRKPFEGKTAKVAKKAAKRKKKEIKNKL